MGSYARAPSWDDKHANESDGRQLGDVLSGQFADVDIDSVEAVRDERNPE
ncbi:hypothetical protein [Halocatena halophila]